MGKILNMGVTGMLNVRFGNSSPIGSLKTSNIRIAGHTWNLYMGFNPSWEVFSFTSAEGDINHFSADLNLFLSEFQ